MSIDVLFLNVMVFILLELKAFLPHPTWSFNHVLPKDTVPQTGLAPWYHSDLSLGLFPSNSGCFGIPKPKKNIIILVVTEIPGHGEQANLSPWSSCHPQHGCHQGGEETSAVSGVDGTTGTGCVVFCLS